MDYAGKVQGKSQRRQMGMSDVNADVISKHLTVNGSANDACFGTMKNVQSHKKLRGMMLVSFSVARVSSVCKFII